MSPVLPIGTMVAVLMSGWYMLTSGFDDEMLISRTRKWALITTLFVLYAVLLIATWGGLVAAGLALDVESEFDDQLNPWLISILLALLVGVSSIPAILIVKSIATRLYGRFLFDPDAAYPLAYPPFEEWATNCPWTNYYIRLPRPLNATSRTENGVLYSSYDPAIPLVYLNESPCFDGPLGTLVDHANVCVWKFKDHPGFQVLYMTRLSDTVIRSMFLYEESADYAGAVLDALHIQTPDVFIDILVQHRAEDYDTEFAPMVFRGFRYQGGPVIDDSQLIRAEVVAEY